MDVSRSGTFLNLLILLFHPCLYVTESENTLINILLWDQLPVFEQTLGFKYFVNQNCRFQNCFLTDNRSLLNDTIHFDVILFNSFQVSTNSPKLVIPTSRTPEQIYIFISSEPPTMYPLRSIYDGFFNYTFTYKLDSDVTWRFFVVRNKSDNKVIAPKKDIKWIDFKDMEPITEDIKHKLRSKNRAAVWLVSHCTTPNSREDFVVKLKSELESYNLNLDITGRWHCIDSYLDQVCPCNFWHKTNGNYSQEDCYKWILENHYFYLAFENSMCEDYVTEKILTATKNYAIPIVLGGADYSRLGFDV